MPKRLVILGVLALFILVAVPAWAISNGVPDEGEHPQVGQLFFYVPDAVDPRFDDPGSWFNCSGTLLTSTLVLTAGHCAFGVGADGTSTTTGGGSGNGGNDVWLSFSEVPDYDGVPLSANYDRDENDQRYVDRVAWLTGNADWVQGTAHAHPEYDDNAFFLHDLGIIELSEPVIVSEYGELPALGYLDTLVKSAKSQARFTPVGYGLERLLPIAAEGGDIRMRADAKLNNLVSGGGVYALFSNNNGAVHQGGTCPGDSGGPIFLEGTNEIVAVNSFGIAPTCPSGIDGGYRVDQTDDLDWLATWLS
jgi:hypothetical protein